MMSSMSMTISGVYSARKWPNCSRPPLKLTTSAPPLCLRMKPTLGSYPSKFVKRCGFVFGRRCFGFSGRMKLGFCVRAENGGGERKSSGDKEEEEELEELRGRSTMPERFRYLTKEAPDSPLRWPWFIALAFLIYTWRSVLCELTNWRKVLIGMFSLAKYLSKLVLALIFRFMGDPITYAIFYMETGLAALRSFYYSIAFSAPIWELTMIIMLASTVLAIGEVASPTSVNRQPYLLIAASISGYAAVRGVISEPVFWSLLFGLFSFAQFVKKRDYVSSALPVATVLAAIGEPWIRVLAIISFTTLAIHHHSKNRLVEGKEEAVVPASSGTLPFPLLAVALAIGIRLAVKWLGYRHLTWMIV